jgi:hypothetical protein
MTRRNWLCFGTFSAFGVVAALFFAHPYARQAVLGPRIRGLPLVYWQDRIRDAADPGEGDTDAVKFLSLLGIKERTSQPDWDIYAEKAPSDLLPVVLSLVSDPNPKVRYAVAWVLWREWDSPEVCAALLKLLDDPQGAVRALAAGGLARSCPIYSAALPKLRQRMTDPECQVSAAYGVCRLSQRLDPNATAVLCNRASQTRGDGRSASHDALSCLCVLSKQYPECFVHVVRCFPKDADGRRTSVRLMSAAGPVAVPLLADLLNDTERWVRFLAARELGAMGPDAAEAVPALVRAASDPDVLVRSGARHALRKIDPTRFADNESPAAHTLSEIEPERYPEEQAKR